MKRFLIQFGLSGALLLMPWCLVGEPLKIELPPETSSFKPAAGVELANAQCLICHSVEYVAMQPPFPRAFWASSVKKMREKYGAVIPDSQVESLLDYLVENYGMKTNGASVGTTAFPASPATSSDSKEPKTAESLGVKFGCLSCHGVNKAIVGPALKDIAAKYRTDPTAPARIAEQVHQGGSGKWGPALMPPFPIVTEEEIKILSDWILGRK